MFVRWKRQALTGRSVKYNASLGRSKDKLTAILVESHRVDGRPRQRFVSYLGTIREWTLKDRVYWHLVDFWVSVDKNLDALQIDQVTRQAIETRIAERVPRPTTQDRQVMTEQIAALGGL